MANSYDNPNHQINWVKLEMCLKRKAGRTRNRKKENQQNPSTLPHPQSQLTSTSRKEKEAGGQTWRKSLRHLDSESRDIQQVDVARYMAGMGAGGPGGWQASQPPAHLTLLAAASLFLLLLLLSGLLVLSVLSVGWSSQFWRPHDAAHLSPCPTQVTTEQSDPHCEAPGHLLQDYLKEEFESQHFPGDTPLTVFGFSTGTAPETLKSLHGEDYMDPDYMEHTSSATELPLLQGYMSLHNLCSLLPTFPDWVNNTAAVALYSRLQLPGSTLYPPLFNKALKTENNTKGKREGYKSTNTLPDLSNGALRAGSESNEMALKEERCLPKEGTREFYVFTGYRNQSNCRPLEPLEAPAVELGSAAELEFAQIIIIVVVVTVMVVVIVCLLNHYKVSTRSFINRPSQSRRQEDGLQSVPRGRGLQTPVGPGQGGGSFSPLVVGKEDKESHPSFVSAETWVPRIQCILLVPMKFPPPIPLCTITIVLTLLIPYQCCDLGEGIALTSLPHQRRDGAKVAKDLATLCKTLLVLTQTCKGPMTYCERPPVTSWTHEAPEPCHGVCQSSQRLHETTPTPRPHPGQQKTCNLTLNPAGTCQTSINSAALFGTLPSTHLHLEGLVTSQKIPTSIYTNK
ncbi:Low-density lipoprotein receptor class A domain-containing protein 4 [Galemys pyrenaicus]|uniref:Low-density lipoprotein receptor class A domain-containing protein 4 n=1 Tax=Galemys pyrenaicus TaxID=202257 RepID=A0A8J6DE74_GALPY|nr:Low-density lipoprotein receptor class A domain-containing protein 4 [Galemys pyrenaicus]